jgi:LAO/AO transport system kinase
VIRPARDPAELVQAAKGGDRVALARLLSLTERGGDEARAVARLAYREDPPYSVGITGAPGAGKSTLVDRLIVTARGGWPAENGSGAIDLEQVAVLAIDPTSPFSGGAILGDRIRMQDHATDPAVFIRSMATRGHLGGLSLAVPDAVRVLGAVGMPFVLVETVGVGQMEVDVAAAADTTLVVVTPGWGDSMQANKAGLLEVADLFVINKADRAGAREARRDLDQMLDLSAPNDWRPPIIDTIATTGEGVEELWSEIARHRRFLMEHGLLEERRAARAETELRRAIRAQLAVEVERLVLTPAYESLRSEVVAGELDPYEAVDRLFDASRPARDSRG